MNKNNIKEPTICKGCLEVIRYSSQIANEELGLCNSCERERKAVEEDKCVSCGGKGAKELYWGQCEKCFGVEEEGESE